MLRDATAEFPQNGSEAFVVGTAEPVRIIRKNDDNSRLLKRIGYKWTGFRGASGNVTLPISQLRATAKEAIEAAKPRNRKPRRLPKGQK